MPPARSAACERGTPLGLPVVPDVYSISDVSRSSRSSAPGCARAVRQRVVLAERAHRPAVAEAVVELVPREAPGERHGDRARPLRRPVQERRLEPVVEHERDARARLDVEPAGDPLDARQQLVVGDARERLVPGKALAGDGERLGEVHRPATSSIASTIGV